MTNKKRLGLTVPKHLYERLVEQAQFQGKTINAVCLDIFWEYFESKQKEQPQKQNSPQ